VSGFPPACPIREKVFFKIPRMGCSLTYDAVLRVQGKYIRDAGRYIRRSAAIPVAIAL